MAHNMLDPEFYLSLINHNCGLICVVDEQGFFKYANKALFDITGYYQEDVQGKLVIEYLHNNDLQAVKNLFLQLKTYKDAETLRFRIKTKRNEWKWLEAVITNSLHDEHVNGYIIDARDISAKLTNQQELEKNQDFFNSFFQSPMQAIFILSTEGILEQVNETLKQLLSYSSKDLIGEHFSKFIAPSFSFNAIKAIIKAGSGVHSILEGKVVHKQGQILTLKLLIIPIFSNNQVSSILGVAEDITAEKKALKEIEKLSLIASKSASCIIITDALGRIEWVNSEFTKVTGYTMRESMGKKPGELLQGKDTDPLTVQEMHWSIKTKTPFSVEVINYRKNGEKFWFYMDITPLFNDEGKVSKFFALQADITERKLGEEQTRLLAEDLTRRNRELQQFNYIVSHNLRAPVANILGLVSILENIAVDKRTVDKAVEKIKHTALNLDHVIKDLDGILSLRNYVKGEQDEDVCIESVCHEVIQSLQTTIENSGATISLSVPRHVYIVANRAYVYSIVFNLLSNSLKYASPDRIPEVSISYTSEPDKHMILFQDNGVGMDLEKYGEQLFKLYSKFDKQAEGRGLGLYMVKTQVESLDGSINVESKPGFGTTFYLRFPKKI